MAAMTAQSDARPSHGTNQRQKALLTLLACYPPRMMNARIADAFTLALHDKITDREDSEREITLLLDQVTGKVPQQCRVKVCPLSGTDEGKVLRMGEPRHSFVLSEYNRNGDLYRCPHCNVFVAVDGRDLDTVNAAPPPVLHGYLKQLEILANAIYGEYGKLYYGKDCVSSAYVWDASTEEGSTTGSGEFPERIGIAVFFRHRRKPVPLHGDVAEPEGEVQRDSGVWCSCHRGFVDTSHGSYSMVSSVYLEVDAHPTNHDDHTFHSVAHFNGTLVAPTSYFKRAKDASAHMEPRQIISDFGERMQATENHLRENLMEQYFGRAHHIGDVVRTQSKNDIAIKPVLAVSRVSAQEREVDGRSAVFKAASTALSTAPDEEDLVHVRESKKSVWISAVDDDGNTYYYNEETGETSWTPPEETDTKDAAGTDTDLLKSKRKKKKKTSENADHLIDVGTDASTNKGDDSNLTSVWQKTTDDEGNVYYYNESTGETSWDPPGEAAIASQPHVRDVLEGLHLSQPADVYYRSIKHFFKERNEKLTYHTFCTLGALDAKSTEEGNATVSALEHLFPVFGDRRKVHVWLQANS